MVCFNTKSEKPLAHTKYISGFSRQGWSFSGAAKGVAGRCHPVGIIPLAEVAQRLVRLRGGHQRKWNGISCEEDDARFSIPVRNHPRPGLDHAPWIEAHRQAYFEMREHNRSGLLDRQAAGERPPLVPVCMLGQMKDTRNPPREWTETWEDYWAQVSSAVQRAAERLWTRRLFLFSRHFLLAYRSDSGDTTTFSHPDLDHADTRNSPVVADASTEYALRAARGRR